MLRLEAAAAATCTTAERLASVAVAVSAVYRTIGRGLERELSDIDTAARALKRHARNVDHRSGSETATLLVVSHRKLALALLSDLYHNADALLGNVTCDLLRLTELSLGTTIT